MPQWKSKFLFLFLLTMAVFLRPEAQTSRSDEQTAD